MIYIARMVTIFTMTASVTGKDSTASGTHNILHCLPLLRVGVPIIIPAFTVAESLGFVLGRLLQRLATLFAYGFVRIGFRRNNSGHQIVPLTERLDGAYRNAERTGDSFISHAPLPQFLYILFLYLGHSEYLR